MRKGAKRNDWTISEITYLKLYAGKVSKREICKHLKRSSVSVRKQAEQLRRHGYPIMLRCFVPSTSICPSCGKSRSRISERSGLCRVCDQEKQLMDIEGRIASLMQQLPVKERATYDDTEAERESEVTVKPRTNPVPLGGTSYYERCKAEERACISVERWEVDNMHRRIKAAQKRKERIDKKVKSMGL